VGIESKIADVEVLAILLNSLPKSYDSFGRLMETIDDLDLNKLKARLLQEYQDSDMVAEIPGKGISFCAQSEKIPLIQLRQGTIHPTNQVAGQQKT